jgi:hypothetical protein
VLTFSFAVASSRADVCPPPPQQIAKDVATDAKVKIGNLGPLSAGEVDAKITPVTRELFSKYPNADKVVVAQMIVSTTCNLLVSSGLTGRELADRVDKLNETLKQLKGVFNFWDGAYGLEGVMEADIRDQVDLKLGRNKHFH